jgi:hypothetical protein
MPAFDFSSVPVFHPECCGDEGCDLIEAYWRQYWFRSRDSLPRGAVSPWWLGMSLT